MKTKLKQLYWINQMHYTLETLQNAEQTEKLTPPVQVPVQLDTRASPLPLALSCGQGNVSYEMRNLRNKPLALSSWHEALSVQGAQEATKARLSALCIESGLITLVTRQFN